MCGRFTLTSSEEQIRSMFAVDLPDDLPPRFNIAPTQPVLAIRERTPGNREAVMLHWGLVPSWANDRKIASKMINARGETVADKPAYGQLLRHRRCLIIADGFYEWKPNDATKEPFHFHRPNREPFAFAGLWDRWLDVDGSPYETCTIVNTSAEGNSTMSAIHHRIPVMLDPSDYDRWLDPKFHRVNELRKLLVPCPEDWLDCQPVSRAVNRVAIDDARCLAPPGSDGATLLEASSPLMRSRKSSVRQDQPSLWDESSHG